MQFEKVASVVDGVPHMTRAQGRQIYDHIVRTRPSRVLELGFASGVSTCYMAAALDEIGGDGRIVTVDIPDALTRPTTIHDLLERTGLGHWVDVRIDPTSYTWELKRMLEQPEHPEFDFVFIDGAHTFDVDALAFLLVDELLAPDGWVLFDDLDWSLAGSPSMSSLDWVRALPTDRQQAHQIRSIVEVVVPSRDYDDVLERSGWAWAHRRPEQPPRAEITPEALVELQAVLVTQRSELAAQRPELAAARREVAAARREAQLWKRRYEALRGRAPIRVAAGVIGRVRALRSGR